MTEIEGRLDACEQQILITQDEMIHALQNEIQSLKDKVISDHAFAKELAQTIDSMKTGLIDVQKENEEIEGSVMSMLTEMSRELAWIVTRIDQIKSKVDEQQAIFDTTMTDDNR